MKPLVTFADPESTMIAYLKSAFADRSEAYKATTVSTGYPKASGFHVQVELEVGAADDYPITERAQVRLNCWAPSGQRTNAKNLAALTQGLIYSHPGDSAVAGCQILIGRSSVITDPDTGYLMCWFLARVNLKAVVL